MKLEIDIGIFIWVICSFMYIIMFMIILDFFKFGYILEVFRKFLMFKFFFRIMKLECLGVLFGF